ncbi:MAG TPA: sterol desaturase family protein [Polyangium sp.]|nr:sterol desaturase family protein [Polyangium sp.]
MNITVLSIPIYFLFIGIESLIGWRRGQRIFRATDVVVNLMLGLAQIVFGALAVWFIAGNYVRLYEHHIFEIGVTDVWPWVILFFAQDFLYYWFHRVSHRMNLAWAGHSPHHQSEDMNFAVALRQGPFQPLVSSLFYLPLAVLGFPPAMFATVVGFNTVYQFFLHTEVVRTLGPFEWILNTPSHHRVHHGCNGRYIDKNHGAILIIWDRLFGTFEPESDRPVYGTVKPVASFNPVKCTWEPFAELLNLMRSAPRFLDKLSAPFRPPEWRPAGMEPVEMEVLPDRPKFHVRTSRAALVYVFVAFVLATAVSLYFLFQGQHASIFAKVVFTAWFVATLGGLGGVIEQRSWAKWIEGVRLVATPAVIYLLAS